MSRPAARARRLLVCGFGPFPGFPDNPAGRVVERLRAQGWAPGGAAVDYQLIPTTWDGGYEAAAAAAARTGAQAVLVLGVAGGADGFRVETRACNHAGVGRPDAGGACRSRASIQPSGPLHAAPGLPAGPMIAAVAGEGLPVTASTDAGDYLCNYVFYRLLTDGRTPPTAFLHLPPGLESDALDRGVKAAITAAVG